VRRAVLFEGQKVANAASKAADYLLGLLGTAEQDAQ
jgi:hypothetical protein